MRFYHLLVGGTLAVAGTGCQPEQPGTAGTPLVGGLVGDSQLDLYRPDTVVTLELEPYTDNSYNFTLLLQGQPVGRFIVAPYLDEAKSGSLYSEKGLLASALGRIEGWQEVEALTDTAGFGLPGTGWAPSRAAP
jgi:uncharacterized protein (DUF2126 family)